MHFTQAFIARIESYISHTTNAPCAFFAASFFDEHQQKNSSLPEKFILQLQQITGIQED